MKLITKAIEKELNKNWVASTKKDTDHIPVVKFFDPTGSATWLITELNPENQDIAFGLCDLGMGFPELGYVSISELKAVKSRFGLGIERDKWFTTSYPLSAFTKVASEVGYITDNYELLNKAIEKDGD